MGDISLPGGPAVSYFYKNIIAWKREKAKDV
jgi:hypothetical protein